MDDGRTGKNIWDGLLVFTVSLGVAFGSLYIAYLAFMAYGQWLSDVAAEHPTLAWIVLGGIFIYFIPSMIAVMAKRKNAVAIVVLNIFLGWTFLGWLGSLIWALVNERRAAEPVVVTVNAPPAPQPTRPETQSDDVVEKLSRAAQMRAAGHLSDEEFRVLKARLIGAPSAAAGTGQTGAFGEKP